MIPESVNLRAQSFLEFDCNSILHIRNQNITQKYYIILHHFLPITSISKIFFIACVSGGIVSLIAEKKLYDALQSFGGKTNQKFTISASFFAISAFFLIFAILGCFK